MPMIGKGAVPLDPATAAYEPSTMATLGQFLFGHDGSWADSKAHLRDLQYQQAMRPVQAQMMQAYLQNFTGSDDQSRPQVQPGDVIQGGSQGDALPAPTTIPESIGAGLGNAVATAVGAPPSGPLVPQAGQSAQATGRPRDPYDLSDPRVRRILGGGAVLGMPGNAQQLEIAKAVQPHITSINGWALNDKDGSNAGRYFGEAPVKGAIPAFDQNGRQIGWQMQDGSLQAIQASSQADTLGKTLGSPVTVPRSDGSTALMLGGDYFGRGGGSAAPAPGGGPLVAQRGGQPGSAPSAALGVSQTPGDRAEAEAAGRVEGEGGANARLNGPNQLASAEQAVTLIDNLIKDPQLGDRLGWKSKLPALPGTHGVALDASMKQLSGKVFLQAYGELKGAGAITELEGQKAQDAVARLNAAQSPEDYITALQDLRSVVAAGMGRTQDRTKFGQSGRGGQASAPAAPPAAQRQRGAVYDTPRGPMTWTGTGWLAN